MSNPINSGVGQWDKTSDLEWRLKQMQYDMNIMWSRLTDLEVARDENSEHYEAMESFKDAGEAINQHYIDCLFPARCLPETPASRRLGGFWVVDVNCLAR